MAKLRPAIDLMMGAVHESGGIVNRVQGDGVMALFGAPIAVADHARRACHAAVSMKQRIALLGDDEISIRIGIHSGDVVAHMDVGDFAHSYDVTGKAAHLAARLEQSASTNEALMSEDTYLLVRDFVEVGAQRSLEAKGFKNPVSAWELVGLTDRETRKAGEARRALLPFVGRSAELKRLTDALAVAASGQSTIVCVDGPPGIGKTRLLEVLLADARIEGWRIWRVEGDSVQSRSPLKAIRSLLKLWLNIGEEADHLATTEALTSRLASMPVLARHKPPLAAVLNLNVLDTAWLEAEQIARQKLIEAAICDVLSDVQCSGPLLLAVEDFHWLDSESQHLLLRLASRLQRTRTAFVITKRMNEVTALPESSVTTLSLAELSQEQAAWLLDSLLGCHVSLTPIKQKLLEATGRLPLFLEEAVRHLVESNVLTGPPGAQAAIAGDHGLVTPRSVQAVAAARIDALPPQLRTIVRNASAIGRRFSLDVLIDVLQLSSFDISSAIAALTSRQILDVDGEGGGTFVEFRHELIRETAYGALLRSKRREMHLQILRVLERRYAGQLRDWFPVLAHHAALAENWRAAADYERKSADSAIDSSSFSAALKACQRARTYLDRLPETPDTLIESIDVRLMLRSALAPTSDFSLWLRFVDEALERALECADYRRTFLARVHRAWALNFAGAPKDAVPAARLAVELAVELDDAGSLALASFVLGQAYYAAGDYGEALTALDRAAQWYVGEHLFERAGGSATTSVSCHMMRTTCLASLGRFNQAEAASAQAHEISGITSRTYDRALARYGEGFLRMQRGTPGEAIVALEQARQLCIAGNLPTFQILVDTHLGAALIAVGQAEAAEATLQNAVNAAEEMHHVVALAAGRIFRAALDVSRGAADQAWPLLIEQRENTRKRGFKGLEVTAMRLLALASMAAKPPRTHDALISIRDAIALAKYCGAAPQEARCLLTLAELERQCGALEWRGHAESAFVLFDQMHLAPEAAKTAKFMNC